MTDKLSCKARPFVDAAHRGRRLPPTCWGAVLQRSQGRPPHHVHTHFNARAGWRLRQALRGARNETAPRFKSANRWRFGIAWLCRLSEPSPARRRGRSSASKQQTPAGCFRADISAAEYDCLYAQTDPGAARRSGDTRARAVRGGRRSDQDLLSRPATDAHPGGVTGRPGAACRWPDPYDAATDSGATA